MGQMETQERQAWMGLLAKAREGQILDLLGELKDGLTFDWLRKPEVGSVMIRGRMGGTGSAFNMGEMTVTRCALKLKPGVIGHGYVQGRSKADSEAAALVDALMQTEQAADIRAKVLDPLEAKQREIRETRARKAAATKVDFFTMARGED
jgi:alpha-D-ribose 1-methylphosphonate 5-triphosphate synthase subunit PhnG